MSFTERAKDKLEKLAGPARARMGDMAQNERSEAERATRQDEVRGKHAQEDVRDVPDDFTS